MSSCTGTTTSPTATSSPGISTILRTCRSRWISSSPITDRQADDARPIVRVHRAGTLHRGPDRNETPEQPAPGPRGRRRTGRSSGEAMYSVSPTSTSTAPRSRSPTRLPTFWRTSGSSWTRSGSWTKAATQRLRLRGANPIVLNASRSEGHVATMSAKDWAPLRNALWHHVRGAAATRTLRRNGMEAGQGDAPPFHRSHSSPTAAKSPPLTPDPSYCGIHWCTVAPTLMHCAR